MEAKVYNTEGKETGKVTLPEGIFGLRWNADLVHQVVLAMQANARSPWAHTKDRGEVRGGGRKPWKQKGTGRARHGSTRSPIWRGGGITHGPRNEKVYTQKVNRQARQKALLVALSRKYKDGQVMFVDSIEMQEPKAAVAKAVIAGLSRAGAPVRNNKNALLIALPNAHKPTQKSFGNFGNVTVEEVRNLNPVNVLSAKYLIIANPQAAIDTLSKKRVAVTKPLEKPRGE